MRKTHYALIPVFAFILYVFLTASSNGRATAANDDRTGAPGSNGTCTSCHGGGSFGTVTASIQMFTQGTTNAVTSYTAGTAYDIRVTISNSAGTPAGYGFEFTCLTSPGNVAVANAYTISASNVKQKLVTSGTFNGRRYVEHMGVTAVNTFNFSWTAPTAGTGTVKFYASGVAVNGANGDNGDNGAAGTSLTITESAPLSSGGVVTNVSCNGGNNGAINLTVAGGTSPYTYNWGSGITTEDRTNLTAGNYTVTITDFNSTVTTANFTITEPSVLLVSGTTTPVLCNGENSGTINITASGATPNYTYNWGSGIITEDRNNVSSGNYTVTVTDSKSCIASASFTVSQPSALSAGNTHGNIACFGGSTTVNVTASGGTSPYTGIGNFSASAGTTNYTVTDNNGCTASTSANITEPALLTADANDITIPCSGGSGTVTVTAAGGTAPYNGTGSYVVTTPGTQIYQVTDANGCIASVSSIVSSNTGLSVADSVVNISCNGVCDGSINTVTTGGTGPYTFIWSNNSNSENISALCPGTYTQTVTDNANCTVINTFTINDVAALQLSISSDTILCHGEQSISTANVSGGTSPYNYFWNNGNGAQMHASYAGTVSVTVTDANFCALVQSKTITEPDSLDIIVIEVLPDDGTMSGIIDINIIGGTSPYTISWSNGGTGEVILQLQQGLYSATVTDANGCEKTISNIAVLNTDIVNMSDNEIKIYPNPFKEKLIVQMHSTATVNIFNMQGEVIKTFTVSQGESILELSEILAGVYIAEIKNNGNTRRIKVLKTDN